ncbi:MAG TPA: hypothetical protein VHH34_23870 [Pseudonocardiaceae bacterium]|nr:hypothetical protein [Pseudonocardiaceae bacterium]
MPYRLAGHRRRAALSVSVPADQPVDKDDPIEQLDHVVDVLNKVNRVLPLTGLGRAELIAIAGLLTQISGALLTVTDLIGTSAQHCDRTRAAAGSLRDCRDGYAAAHTFARAFHADLKQGARQRTPCGNGCRDKRTSDEPEDR